jgi:hypothetical protein
MTNAGRASAAGLVAGAYLWSGTCQTLKSGSGAQVEAGLGHGNNHAPVWAALRQGSRNPLACYGWCRALLGFLAAGQGGNCRVQLQPGNGLRSGQESHNERADWPMSRPRGRVAGVLLQSPVILGRMRLRPQAASRERCRLWQRPAIQVVRATLHAPVFLEVDRAEQP